jgi:hypothetical protein
LAFDDDWQTKLFRSDSTLSETGIRAALAASMAVEYFFRYF